LAGTLTSVLASFYSTADNDAPLEILYALYERPGNFWEIWMTVYLGHKVIVDVPTTGRKLDDINRVSQMPRKRAKGS
jgi:hypothetical protein